MNTIRKRLGRRNDAESCFEGSVLWYEVMTRSVLEPERELPIYLPTNGLCASFSSRIPQDAQNDIPASPQGARRLKRTLAVRCGRRATENDAGGHFQHPAKTSTATPWYTQTTDRAAPEYRRVCRSERQAPA